MAISIPNYMDPTDEELVRMMGGSLIGPTMPTSNPNFMPTASVSVTAAEAARLSGVSVSKIYDDLRAGKFVGAYRGGGPGSPYHIPANQLPAFNAKNRIANPAYDALLSVGAQFGMTRWQTGAILQDAGIGDPGQAYKYLMSTMAPGFDEFKAARPDDKTRLTTYMTFQPARVARLLNTSMEPGPGRYPVEDDKYMDFQGTIGRASYLGHYGDSTIVTDSWIGKPDKYVKRTGVHPTLWSDTLPAVTGAIPAGPGSPFNDRFYMAKAAMIIGGDPFGGQALSNIGGRVGQNVAIPFSADAGPLPSLEDARSVIGTTFERGSQVALFRGHQGWRDPHWNTQVRDVVSFRDAGMEGEGLLYVLAQSVAFGESNTGLKAFGTKVNTTQAPWLAQAYNAADASQTPLGLHLAMNMKEPMGAAYQTLNAQSKERLASMLGMKDVAELDRSWSELGFLPLEAYLQRVAPDRLMNVTVPTPVHRSYLFNERGEIEDHWARAGVTKDNLTPLGTSGDYFMARPTYTAVVGDVGVQMEREWNAYRHRLSMADLDKVTGDDMALRQQLIEEGGWYAGSFQRLIESHLASTGQSTTPRWAPMSLEGTYDRGAIRDIFMKAEEELRGDLGVAATEAVPREAIDRRVLEIMSSRENELSNIGFRLPGGTVVPSPSDVMLYSSLGERLGVEVNPYARAYTGLLRDYAEMGEGMLAESETYLARRQAELAGSPMIGRQAMTLMLPDERMAGGVAHGSWVLPPGSAYFADLSEREQAVADTLGVRISRQPFGGGVEATHRLLNERDIEEIEQQIGYKIQRGTTLLPYITQQANAGDFDSDLVYAYATGKLQYDQSSGTWSDSEGKQIADMKQLRAIAAAEIERGASDIFAEMPGYFSNLEEAKSYLQSTMGKLRLVTDEQFIKAFEERAEVRGGVGVKTNMFRRMGVYAEDASPEVKETVAGMYAAGYSLLQRPAEMATGLELMFRASQMRMSGYGSPIGTDSEGKPIWQQEAGVTLGGPAAYAQAAAYSLLQEVGAQGQTLPDEAYAAMLGSDKTRGGIQAAVSSYRKGEAQFSDVVNAIAPGMGLEEFAQSPAGGFLMGMEAMRIAREVKGASMNTIVDTMVERGRGAFGRETAMLAYQRGLNAEHEIMALSKRVGKGGNTDPTLPEWYNAAISRGFIAPGVALTGNAENRLNIRGQRVGQINASALSADEDMILLNEMERGLGWGSTREAIAGTFMHESVESSINRERLGVRSVEARAEAYMDIAGERRKVVAISDLATDQNVGMEIKTGKTPPEAYRGQAALNAALHGYDRDQYMFATMPKAGRGEMMAFYDLIGQSGLAYRDREHGWMSWASDEASKHLDATAGDRAVVDYRDNTYRRYGNNWVMETSRDKTGKANLAALEDMSTYLTKKYMVDDEGLFRAGVVESIDIGDVDLNSELKEYVARREGAEPLILSMLESFRDSPMRGSPKHSERALMVAAMRKAVESGKGATVARNLAAASVDERREAFSAIMRGEDVDLVSAFGGTLPPGGGDPGGGDPGGGGGGDGGGGGGRPPGGGGSDDTAAAAGALPTGHVPPGMSSVTNVDNRGSITNNMVQPRHIYDSHREQLEFLTRRLREWDNELRDVVMGSKEFNKVQLGVINRFKGYLNEALDFALTRKMSGGASDATARAYRGLQEAFGESSLASDVAVAQEHEAQKYKDEKLDELGGDQEPGLLPDFLKKPLGILGAGVGGIMGGFNKLMSGWGMFYVSRMVNLATGAMKGGVEQLSNEELAMQRALGYAGLSSGEPSGLPGELMKLQAGMTDMQSGIGRAAWDTWGPLLNRVTSQGGIDLPRVAGYGASVILPAAAAGAAAGFFTGNPVVGGGVMAAALIGGTIQYNQGMAEDVSGRTLARLTGQFDSYDRYQVPGMTQQVADFLNRTFPSPEPIEGEGIEYGFDRFVSRVPTIIAYGGVGPFPSFPAERARSTQVTGRQILTRFNRDVGGNRVPISDPSTDAVMAMEARVRPVLGGNLAGLDQLSPEEQRVAIQAYVESNKNDWMTVEQGIGFVGTLLPFASNRGLDPNLVNKLGTHMLLGGNLDLASAILGASGTNVLADPQAMLGAIGSSLNYPLWTHGLLGDRVKGVGQYGSILRDSGFKVSPIAAVGGPGPSSRPASFAVGGIDFGMLSDDAFGNMLMAISNQEDWIQLGGEMDWDQVVSATKMGRGALLRRLAGDNADRGQISGLTSQFMARGYTYEQASRFAMKTRGIDGGAAKLGLAMQNAASWEQFGVRRSIPQLFGEIQGQSYGDLVEQYTGEGIQRGQISGLVSQQMGMGIGYQPALQFASKLAGQPGQIRIAQQLLGQDMYRWSQLASADFGGLASQYGLQPIINPETGINVFTEQRWDLQAQSAGAQYSHAMFGLNQQQAALTWKTAMLFGGKAPGAGGEVFDFGAGQIALQWQAQQASYGASLQQAKISRQQLDLQREHFMENWLFNKEKSEVQFGWQADDLQRQQEEAAMQYGWKREDLTYNRAVSNLQYAWQMEDSTENIRRARGRERYQLIRQQERETVMYNLQQGRMDTEEDRMEKVRDLEEERFDIADERLEQQKEWTEEQMEMEKKQFEERWELQKKAHDASVAAMKAQMGLAEQLHNIQVANYKFQLDQEQKQINEAKAYAGVQAELAAKSLEIQQNEAKAMADWEKFWRDHFESWWPEWMRHWNTLLDKVKEAANSSSSSSSSTEPEDEEEDTDITTPGGSTVQSITPFPTVGESTYYLQRIYEVLMMISTTLQTNGGLTVNVYSSDVHTAIDAALTLYEQERATL